MEKGKGDPKFQFLGVSKGEDKRLFRKALKGEELCHFCENLRRRFMDSGGRRKAPHIAVTKTGGRV